MGFMTEFFSNEVRSKGTRVQARRDLAISGSVAYSSWSLSVRGLQDRVGFKGSSRDLVVGARVFFAWAWSVTLIHHFDRVDRCGADQRMSDERPAWYKVNSTIR